MPRRESPFAYHPTAAGPAYVLYFFFCMNHKSFSLLEVPENVPSTSLVKIPLLPPNK